MSKKSICLLVASIFGVIAVTSAVEAVTSKLSNNNLRLYGKAFNPKGYFTVSDDMVIREKLNVKGNISDSDGNLTLDDTVSITGDVIVEENAEVKGELYNSNDVVTINDDLYVGGLFSMNSIPTPTEATCTTAGALSYDSNYLYLCVAGTWKKVSLQAF